MSGFSMVELLTWKRPFNNSFDIELNWSFDIELNWLFDIELNWNEIFSDVEFYIIDNIFICPEIKANLKITVTKNDIVILAPLCLCCYWAYIVSDLYYLGHWYCYNAVNKYNKLYSSNQISNNLLLGVTYEEQ